MANQVDSWRSRRKPNRAGVGAVIGATTQYSNPSVAALVLEVAKVDEVLLR